MIIDSRIGGLGDVWMRLLALYSMAFLTRRRDKILIPPGLISLATTLFEDRIDVGSDGEPDVIFTHLGLRDTLPRILRGERFISPFFWQLRADRKIVRIKHHINDVTMVAMSLSRRLLLPPKDSLNKYQGYSEISAIPAYRIVKYDAFIKQSTIDLKSLSGALGAPYLHRKSDRKVIIFPSGSAHQIMPSEWASRHFPAADYAFHVEDPYQSKFRKQGLSVIAFHNVEGMLKLGAQYRIICATDSFPSHLFQTFRKGVFLMMTQQIPERMVHPAFEKSQIIKSQASCCPCSNLARGGHPLCASGREYCVAWEYEEYAARILAKTIE